MVKYPKSNGVFARWEDHGYMLGHVWSRESYVVFKLDKIFFEKFGKRRYKLPYGDSKHLRVNMDGDVYVLYKLCGMVLYPDRVNYTWMFPLNGDLFDFRSENFSREFNTSIRC